MSVAVASMQRLHFTPDTVYEGQFNLLREEDMLETIQLSADGELGQYITFEKDYVIFTGYEQSVRYKLSLPESLPPGKHYAYIYADQGFATTEDSVSSRLRLGYKIEVFSPYPEKYIKAALDIRPGKDNAIGVSAIVQNLGTEAIEQVVPTVTITNGPIEVASVELAPKPVGVTETSYFEDVIRLGDLQGGVYRATAAIAYDDQQLEVVRDFVIGTPLELYVETPVFRAGDINNFVINVRNLWDKQVMDASVSAVVRSGDKTVASFSTPSFDIGAFDTERVTAYFDARTLAPGTYQALLALTHDGETIETVIPIEVVNQGDYQKKLQLLEQPASLFSKGSSGVAIGLGVLIFFNAILAVIVITKLVRRKPDATTTADEAVISFIRKARGMGFTEDEIKQKLQKDGWANAVIERALKR